LSKTMRSSMRGRWQPSGCSSMRSVKSSGVVFDGYRVISGMG
jgi:hypothetical protein